eukprot:CAMPEP_0179317880 /NCGR_PEP_ID=MMETSP0797-20121207/56545_1 /TAXON_ID=47934 /ORGANISM="Dinophysis acuminata, Strain DAEP01" /LENGTH=133 /DNA_ID=CAMNT_0021028929 /DNA_START=77 /DNA_END=475 /DNA_ORIENTATION=+
MSPDTRARDGQQLRDSKPAEAEGCPPARHALWGGAGQAASDITCRASSPCPSAATAIVALHGPRRARTHMTMAFVDEGVLHGVAWLHHPHGRQDRRRHRVQVRAARGQQLQTEVAHVVLQRRALEDPRGQQPG